MRLMNGATETAFENRTIQLAVCVLPFLFLDADDDSVGMKEILDRRAFAQKLRIRCYAESGAGIPRINPQSPLQFLSGLSGNRAFLDDELGRARLFCDQTGDVVDCGEVRLPAFRGRRTHAAEKDIRAAHRFSAIA